VDTENPSFPHPNFSDTINRNVVQSEIEGGVDLYDVPPGTVLEVQTKNHIYTIVHKARGQVLISGHPEFCPSPVEVRIHGSTWGGSMIMTKYFLQKCKQPLICLIVRVELQSYLQPEYIRFLLNFSGCFRVGDWRDRPVACEARKARYVFQFSSAGSQTFTFELGSDEQGDLLTVLRQEVKDWLSQATRRSRT
jgi:hypothetical protein